MIDNIKSEIQLLEEINCYSFYWYLTVTVAEPFLYRLASECFSESNTIFNRQFELWHEGLLTPMPLDNEVSRWFNMWSRKSDAADLPVTLMKSLVFADPNSFPNIRIWLVLACTLLVTSAEAERSFSVLRLIKSNLRSWMVDLRHSALNVNENTLQID